MHKVFQLVQTNLTVRLLTLLPITKWFVTLMCQEHQAASFCCMVACTAVRPQPGGVHLTEGQPPSRWKHAWCQVQRPDHTKTLTQSVVQRVSQPVANSTGVKMVAVCSIGQHKPCRRENQRMLCDVYQRLDGM